MKMIIILITLFSMVINPVMVFAEETERLFLLPYQKTTELPLYFKGNTFVLNGEEFEKDDFCTEDDWIRAAYASVLIGAGIGALEAMGTSVFVEGVGTQAGTWFARILGWGAFQPYYFINITVPLMIGGAIIYGIIFYVPTLWATCSVSRFLDGDNNPFDEDEGERFLDSLKEGLL